MVDAFIGYHLSIGFDLIILICDDPTESYIDRISHLEKVIVLKGDPSHRAKWKNLKSYGYLQNFLNEVMARQTLNTDMAIKMAMERGIDWLVHLDIDELFYCPTQSIHAHFEKLTRCGVFEYNYVNYEAVVDRLHYKNVFTEITLFKKNELHLTKGQLMARAETLRSFSKKPPVHFIAYGNGKSSGKVSDRLISSGPHYFKNTPPSFLLKHRRLFSLYKVLSQPIEWFRRIGLHYNAPIILHYPCCGFDAFLRKYKTLGKFPDRWLGQHEIKNFLPFHLESREMVASGDIDQVEQFYREKVMVGDADLKALLLDRGIFCSITGPASICGSLNVKKHDAVFADQNTLVEHAYEPQ
jgi:hypothetical protein